MRWLLVLAAMLLTAPCIAQDKQTEIEIDGQWLQNESLYKQEGFTKENYRLFYYWLTGQYLLGYCAPHMQERDILGWKMIFRDTGVEHSNLRSNLLRDAAESYDKGASDRLKNPAPSNACVSSLESWQHDMLNVAGVKWP